MSTTQPKKKTIIEQLSDVSYYIAWGPIADTYFQRRPLWLYARMEGADREGTPANFTPEEAEKFRGILFDLAERLRRSAENLEF